MKTPRLIAILVLAELAGAGAGLAQESFVQPDETLPGFRPQSILESHGIDNINPYSGDLGMVLPLGPEYTLSASSKWQLKAYYSAKLWRMDAGLCTVTNEQGVQHAYLRGDPTVGAGWTVSLGYVGPSAIGDGAFTGYFSPDGGFHDGSLGTTYDGTHLRITQHSSPPSYTVEFPDGSKHIFDHVVTPPWPAAGDFTEIGWVSVFPGASNQRYALGSIQDRFGKTVLSATYDPTNTWEVTTISLPTLGQTISLSLKSYTLSGGGLTWQVLDHITFPVFGSTTRTVTFGYADATFTRNVFDNTAGQTTNCTHDSTPNVSVPSLATITFSDFSYVYGMSYYPTKTSGSGENQGALETISLPTGGNLTYTYALTAITCGSGCNPEGPIVPSPPAVQLGGKSAQLQAFWDKSIGVATRCESTSSTPCTPASPTTTTYTRGQFYISCDPQCDGGYDWDPYRVVRRADVVAPGNDVGSPSQYLTRYYFHVAAIADALLPDGGIELERRTYGGATTAASDVRDTVSCWQPVPSGVTSTCGWHTSDGHTQQYALSPLPPKAGETTWYCASPSTCGVPASSDGGACSGSSPCTSSLHGPANTDYDPTAMQYRTTTVTSSNMPRSSPMRTSYTHWAAFVDATHWLLNLYDEKDETENGVTTYRGFEFDTTYADPANGGRVTPGFARGMWTSSTLSDPNDSLLLECRYPDASGNEKWQFSATYAPSVLNVLGNPPYHTLCSRLYSSYPVGTPGGNGDSFGHVYTSNHPGLFNTGSWVTGGSGGIPGTIGWLDFNVMRDLDVSPYTGSGLISASTDRSGVTTGYGYDALGRITQVAPPGESPTFACYSDAEHATTYRAPSSVSCPTSGQSGSIQTWQQYQYDGLGRLIEEVRWIPTPLGAYAVRTHSYDSAGHTTFDSEWASCTSVTDCGTKGPHGTSYSNFDPFGRAQMVVRADGSTTTTSYTDGSIYFSDTKKAVTVNNLNGTCTGGTCSGGTPATTTYASDIYGRLVTVTEPTGDVTSYTYDGNGKLTGVSQGNGAQTRSFTYNQYGFLVQEVTPEKGTVDSRGTLTANGNLKIGSIGNVEERTEAYGTSGSNPKTHDLAYDPAGRVLTESVNGTRYVENCYDGSALVAHCPDGTTNNFSGGTNPQGKLTRRVGSNPLISPYPTVQDDYTYSGLGGRLSTLSTTISGGIGQIDEGWQYNSLGLVAYYAYPHPAGATPQMTVSTVYTAGLPTALYANGLPVVSADYAPSGALEDYTTGFFTGKTVRTTIAPDARDMPRPGSIATSGASVNSLGNYLYDGVGNIDCTTSGSSCTSGQIDTFGYDVRSRLTSATLSTVGSQTYTYDLYGNLLTKGGTTFCVTTCPNNRMPSPYAYDLRGNLTSSPSESYTYDDMNRTMTATASAGWSYFYNGAGERVAKYQASPGWTYTFRDESDRVAAEFAASSPSIDNIFLGSQVVASYANGGVMGNDHVWAFYTSDHLGTPRFLTDASGITFETRKYWPYGEQAVGTGALERLRFATMERDSEAGTGNDRYFDHARYHGSGLGRFLSPDLVAGRPMDPQSWDRYAYARCNPLKILDPNGLWWSLSSSDAQFGYIRNAMIQTVMREDGRATFIAIARDPMKVDVKSTRFTQNTDQASRLMEMRRTGRPPTNKEARTDFVNGEGGISLLMKIDVQQINQDSTNSQGKDLGRFDPGGITILSHEMSHVMDGIFGTNGVWATGDDPTSEEGRAAAFGQAVYDEPEDLGYGAAASIVDYYVNTEPDCLGVCLNLEWDFREN